MHKSKSTPPSISDETLLLKMLVNIENFNPYEHMFKSDASLFESMPILSGVKSHEF